MMGYLGLKFGDLDAGQKSTTIIFRATEAPEEPARIAFTSFRDGNFEIYVMDANGANQTRLTSGDSDDIWPDWSPQGDKIVFSSQEGTGDADIYVMNADGSNQKRLTVGTAYDESPAWSNKGDKIAFDSGTSSTGDLDIGDWDIYVINADGSNLTALTNTGSNITPAWSPDDTKIAFASSGDGNSDVYVMNADGSDRKRLTFDTGDDLAPRWSPDGTKITFTSFGDDNAQIYVMNADGSGRTSLTPSSAFDLIADWSEDGGKLAFTSFTSFFLGIFVMNADGSKRTQITNGFLDIFPAWSPGAVPTVIVPAKSAAPSGESSPTTVASEGLGRLPKGLVPGLVPR